MTAELTVTGCSLAVLDSLFVKDQTLIQSRSKMHQRN